MPAVDDLTLLIEAAKAAGAIATSYFRRDPKVWDKGDGAGPVTQADRDADDMLRTRLMAARPGYGWLSEETPDTPDRLDAARCFIVDPLDGTRAFIEGSTAWAHSLAIVDQGAVTAAVVYLPIPDLLYTAAKGAGARLNGERIMVSTREALDGAEVLATRSQFEPWFWADADVPDVKRQFRSSLAYRLGLVAAGRYDAMLTLRPTWEWDIAAGSLIVTEAGGRATDRKGAALAFNRATPQVDGIVAAGSPVHREITERLA